MLYIFPARVQGAWKFQGGTLDLQQEYQKVTGAMTTGETTVPVENGAVRGDEISFTVAGVLYTGRINGNRIDGTQKSDKRERPFTAVR